MYRILSIVVIRYYTLKELRGKGICFCLQLQIDTVHHDGQWGVWVAGQSEQEVG